eukprot:SAG31_NODE_2624_length_5360_cov_2.184946_4_plen_79_part_00
MQSFASDSAGHNEPSSHSPSLVYGQFEFELHEAALHLPQYSVDGRSGPFDPIQCVEHKDAVLVVHSPDAAQYAQPQFP